MLAYQQVNDDNGSKKRVNFKDTTETKYFAREQDKDNADMLSKISAAGKILLKFVLYGAALIIGLYCAYFLLMGIIFTFCFMLIFLIRGTGGFLGLVDKEQAIESIDNFGFWIVGA